MRMTKFLRLTGLAGALLIAAAAPVSAQGALSNGANHTGTISTAGEIDEWTFTAAQNDAISISVAEIGADSAFWPWIRLIRPDGTQIGTSWGALVGQIDILAAPLTGTYTVRVASNDSGNNDTGDYRLTLAHTPGSFVVPSGDEGGALTNGANHTGTIHVGDLDMWTFTANQGDAISLSIGETNIPELDPGFWPWIRLRRPDGEQIATSWNAFAAQIDILSAPLSGTYTVIVASNDSGHDAAGDYRLTLALTPGTFVVPDGDQGGSMTNGANHAGTIHLGDLDMWTFTANQGDAISVSIGETNIPEIDPGFWPWIRLRRPDGQQIGTTWNTLAAQIDILSAPLTGTYTVLVASNDSGHDAAGEYRLTLARTPGTFTVPDGDDGGAMTNGANHAGSIHRGDLDMWTFTANQGDAISLSIGETNIPEIDPDFWPWIRLRRPDGQQIGTTWNALAAQIDILSAPLTGTYTVVVASNDSGHDAAGDYLLTLALTPAAFVVPAGDHGGPMTNGVAHPGSIHRGDLDQWTFTAVAGANLAITISEVLEGEIDPGFWPWIRLRRPDGQQIGNTWNALNATINIPSAPLTGLYTVVVASNDSGHDAAGHYTLTVHGATTLFTVTPSAGANGTISPNTAQSVASGQPAVFTVTPNAGYAIAGVGGTCGGSLSGTTFTTAPVTMNCTVVASFTPQAEPPTLSLDRTAMNFGATSTGSAFTAQTSGQTIRLVQSGPGAVTWTATPSAPWIQVSPASGSGPAELTVTVMPHATVPISGSVTGSVTFAVTGAANTPGPVTVTLIVQPHGTTGGPQGVLDTPLPNTTGVTGSVAVTGWAVDDIEVVRVRILRDPVAGEGANLIFIGDAVMVEGARPDIVVAHPTAPRNTFAGWGYLMLTNFLPNQGNGTFTIHAYGEDAEGHSRLLGSATITCTNATSTAPFGAIDTPGQGAVVSGTVNNFGWVLAPGTVRADVPGGGSVFVFVDGTPIGVPFGWTSRSDISTLFPTGYSQLDSAVAVLPIDTTTLADGVHTIAWGVTATNGLSAGIGSRFFTVLNGSASAATSAVTSMATAQAITARGSAVDRTPVLVRRGFDPAQTFRTAEPDGRGHVTIEAEELDRIEVQLPGAGYSGFLRMGSGVAPLPAGSQLDAGSGLFTWQPGAGFVGSYDLVFARCGANGLCTHREVRVNLWPRETGRPGPQVMIDTPAARQQVSGPFTVAGWAIDPGDTSGVGIATVHVWAYPVCNADVVSCEPIFVGVDDVAGGRPDVAAAYGARFERSGYGLTASGLPPGEYDLAVFAWSPTSGFSPARVVRVEVIGGASRSRDR